VPRLLHPRHPVDAFHQAARTPHPAKDRANPPHLDPTGITAKALAEEINLHPGTISRTLSLLDLAPEVQEQVAEGKISAKAGVAIARHPDPVVQSRVATQAVEEDQSADQVGRKVRQRQGTKAKSSPQPFVQWTIKRGTRVVVHGRLTGAQIINALETALKMARQELNEEEDS